jgi:hypothetical protein
MTTPYIKFTPFDGEFGSFVLYRIPDPRGTGLTDRYTLYDPSGRSTLLIEDNAKGTQVIQAMLDAGVTILDSLDGVR